MKHIYKIHGMTCNGCRGHVEETLGKVEGVTKATVTLENAEAVIDMEKHIPLNVFEKALMDDGGSYSISLPDDAAKKHQQEKEEKKANQSATGIFYCPMHCEGEKTYDKPGDCPVCGMDLVEEVKTSTNTATEYTCPMHPEVIRDEPGSCPICGMDLVPKAADESAEKL